MTGPKLVVGIIVLAFLSTISLAVYYSAAVSKASASVTPAVENNSRQLHRELQENDKIMGRH